jgi:hypothetical protein
MSRLDEHVNAATLDLRVMARVVVAALLFWIVPLAGATIAGYPGAVCMTPLAWVLGTWVGTQCALRSRSARRRRVLEAGISGALLGLLQGLIFFMLQRALLPTRPEEQRQALLISIGILIVGTIVCALLALLTAAAAVRRLTRSGTA